MSGATTTLDALHEGILEGLRARFADRITHYGAYEPWDDLADGPDQLVRTPALLLEVEDLAEALLDRPDPFGRLAVTVGLAIHCVLSMRTERLQQALPQFAAAVLATVLPQHGVGFGRGERWGLGDALSDPEGPTAQPGEFRPGLHGRDAWIVRWTQTLYLDPALPE